MAERSGYSPSGVRALENGQNDLRADAAEVLAPVVRATAAYLLTGDGAPAPEPPLVRIIGRAGANPDDSIIYTTADDVYDYAPLPPGGTSKAAAVEVVGHSMRWVAEDGSLIYFEQQHTPPTEAMLGDVVIAETDDGQVLIKRLLRGSEPGRFDLESTNGPPLRDRRLKWAAEITAIVPPRQARRIIKRGAA